MSFLTDRLKKVADLSKHGYDLPERHLFSCKVGQLLPVMAKSMVLGDKFDINVIESTQTVPFNKAAFFRCKKYYHFWFVPYSYIWDRFDSFITQRDNPYSANSKGSAYMPSFYYDSLLALMGLNANNATLNAVDEYGVLNYRNRLRLADLLRFGNWQDVMKDPTNLTYATKCYNYFNNNKKTVNAMVFGAYQYIWNFAYRNKYFDTIMDPQEYNFDDIDCTTASNARLSSVRLAKIIKLRYRQWDHDMFTGLLPSSQYGSVESIELPKLGTENNTFVELRDTPTQSVVGGAPSYDRPSSGSNQMLAGVINNGDGTTSVRFAEVTGKLFDVLQLRKAEALQKWRETTMRNGRDANDQYLGHFGMKSKHATDHHPIYVGGFDSRIVVDQVTATSNTQGVDPSSGQQNIGSVLGQLAGKGVSLSSDHHIKFTAPDHGILMCLFSIAPEADYNASGLDPQHTMLQPFDFFTPELENLGFEPVTASELSIKPVTVMPSQVYGGGRGNDLTDIPTGWNPNNVLGYLPRYHQYKTSVDLLHGEFASGMSLEAMAVPRGDINASLYDYQQGGTAQAPTYEATYQGMRPKTFYIDPGCCDHLFPIATDSNENTDQFYNLVKFDIKAVRPMSVLGLPY